MLFRSERGARKEEEARKAAEEAEQQRAKDAETQRQAAIAQEDDELQNQIPAQISALQGGISELQDRVDAHESGETDDFSAVEDLKDTETKLQQLNTRQTYLTAKVQARAIEDPAAREKALAEIEKTYAENKKKTEAVTTSATPTAANTIEQVLKDAGIDSHGPFVKAANEFKAARRKEALDAANTIEDKAARTEAIKNVDLEFPKKNYTSTDTLDTSNANAILRALRGVGLPEAAKGKPQISAKDFAKKKDDLSLKLKDFVAKSTAATTAPAPVVEAATPVEPAPVVEAAAPVEPAPVVEPSEVDVAAAFDNESANKNLGITFSELKEPYRKLAKEGFKNNDFSTAIETIAQHLKDAKPVLLAKPRTPRKSTGVAPTVASTVQNVESEINRVFKGAKLGDKVVIAASPESAGVSVTAPEGEVVRGAVVGGKAYLFADNIEQGEEIATLLHEVGAHVGMKDLVGAANYNWLISKIKGWSASKLENVEVKSAKAADARAKGDNEIGRAHV